MNSLVRISWVQAALLVLGGLAGLAIAGATTARLELTLHSKGVAVRQSGEVFFETVRLVALAGVGASLGGLFCLIERPRIAWVIAGAVLGTVVGLPAVLVAVRAWQIAQYVAAS
jgi:hypothetical protein